ncbi:elongator complex protein 5 [Erpetoichthys calabaricus]|uniref:Elongator complex protein 5 n=1 Tax=Erpetoichthys calabaricus TaxID=27687 RepID=A0A8C4SFR7_ERPCA|nr:elongator complex protein 5 [Erpetoichthys calabaricus]
MLSEVITGSEGGEGFVLIKDCVQCGGRGLLKSFIKAALLRNETVHVFEFEISQEEMYSGLTDGTSSSLVFHNGYTDPLNWISNEKPFDFSIQSIKSQIDQSKDKESEAKNVILVLDSLSWLLHHIPITDVCQLLQEPKRKESTVKRIIALMHSELHDQGIVGSVSHMANTVVTLSPIPEFTTVNWEVDPYAIGETVQRKKSGKVNREEECYTVQKDFSLIIHHDLHNRKQAIPKPDNTAQVDPAANLTFNLRLSEEERHAKERLSLPFTFSEKKKHSILQPRPGGGKIVYEPDAQDDFDEEDPDDDLDV